MATTTANGEGGADKDAEGGDDDIDGGYDKNDKWWLVNVGLVCFGFYWVPCISHLCELTGVLNKWERLGGCERTWHHLWDSNRFMRFTRPVLLSANLPRAIHTV